MAMRLKVECPVGSGVYMNLEEVADILTQRVISLFLPDDQEVYRSMVNTIGFISNRGMNI